MIIFMVKSSIIDGCNLYYSAWSYYYHRVQWWCMISNILQTRYSFDILQTMMRMILVETFCTVCESVAVSANWTDRHAHIDSNHIESMDKWMYVYICTLLSHNMDSWHPCMCMWDQRLETGNHRLQTTWFCVFPNASNEIPYRWC